MIDSFGLIPISPLTLKAGVPVGVNLYDWHSSTASPVLLAAADIALDQQDVVRLSANPTRPLYIDRCQRDSYQKYLREEFRDFSQNTDLSDASKFAVLSEVVRGVLSDAFQRNNTSEIVNKSQVLGQHIAALSAKYVYRHRTQQNPSARLRHLHTFDQRRLLLSRSRFQTWILRR